MLQRTITDRDTRIDSAKGALIVFVVFGHNIQRFTSKLPANAKNSVTVKPLPNGGVAAQGVSPGKVPGSSALYEKQIDSAGKTIQYTKTTTTPDGAIAHVKDKITGNVVTP